MPFSVKNAAHFLVYSVAFGGGVMHSFIVSPLAFKGLPIDQFSALQNKVFPVYFIGQAVTPLLLGLTTPLCRNFSYPVLALSALAGALNYLWVLPKCVAIKEDRTKLKLDAKHEKTEEGKTVPSDEMAALNKQFGMYHGISSLLNLVSLLTLAAYGSALSSRLM